MTSYNFKSITPIPNSEEFINIVLSKTQRKTPTQVYILCLKFLGSSKLQNNKNKRILYQKSQILFNYDNRTFTKNSVRLPQIR